MVVSAALSKSHHPPSSTVYSLESLGSEFRVVHYLYPALNPSNPQRNRFRTPQEVPPLNLGIEGACKVSQGSAEVRRFHRVL